LTLLNRLIHFSNRSNRFKETPQTVFWIILGVWAIAIFWRMSFSLSKLKMLCKLPFAVADTYIHIMLSSWMTDKIWQLRVFFSHSWCDIWKRQLSHLETYHSWCDIWKRQLSHLETYLGRHILYVWHGYPML